MCVCVCVRVRACVRACVCACTQVWLLCVLFLCQVEHCTCEHQPDKLTVVLLLSPAAAPSLSLFLPLSLPPSLLSPSLPPSLPPSPSSPTATDRQHGATNCEPDSSVLSSDEAMLHNVPVSHFPLCTNTAGHGMARILSACTSGVSTTLLYEDCRYRLCSMRGNPP